ncbi:hypothetical protein DQP58_16260 [Mycobacterium colombiense]|uniref:Uncharacterized protein n=1 Tax=Mycobacterium colombiense TaxID=339268 RepID=A0A329KEP1_9MYCO|nr:hypothetical protein [Mycobacterium colombiense]RAU93505.1 hypothetical protein DQP58_16260 [Mycobacterium colombiense]
MFFDQTQAATESQLYAVRRWQGRDRFYEQVQSVIAGGAFDTEVGTIADDLAALARPVTIDIEVWRGDRNVKKWLSADFPDVTGQNYRSRRFISTTTSIEVVRSEFINGSIPAIWQMSVRAGVDAIWIPPLGTPEDALQHELLLAPGVNIRIVDVDATGATARINAEVSR